MKGIVDDEEIGNESPPHDFRSLIHDPEYLQLRDMRKQSAEVYDRHGWTDWGDDKICRATDDDEFLVDYDICLCGRLWTFLLQFSQADNYSLYSLRTWVKHDEHANTVLSTWETCFCDVRDGEETDHEWDNEAIDDRYKGEMPKWFSDDDLQHCYVLKDSELLDPNLHLFAEFAFYKKWCLQFWPEDIAGCLPLDIQKVVVETRGEVETEPREKLKAANAIFYISFQCVYDPVTGEEADYRAVVRKTMDGKPGHIRLEVSVGAPNQADGSEERYRN
ncbi:Protein MS5 [Arabidopsis thaliana x Arabidopsis arenosa]|uniref:Protein MS5 n=1 Tax=Arabidopsis thaliana x Arabidopsis arenosa TaxID=1240361 RepID=A0A8T1Y3T1_9BRAS|nr:Protein MS5 [Arabidopsis thaliana x Arabidopsis arenosa]